MSVLIDLIANLEKQLFEADSEAKATWGEFFKWQKESEKEVFSVFENPKSTEEDKYRARLKFDDEEMQKRVQELEPALEKRNKIQQQLSEKAEWLRKGYEISDPTTSDQAPPSQEPFVRPSQEPSKELSKEPPEEPTVRPPQEPSDQQAIDKEAKLQRDKEREMEKRERIKEELIRIKSPSGKSGDDGKSGSPGKSYMLSGSNLKGKKGEIGEKGKDVKKKK
jgi:hypothetical protein